MAESFLVQRSAERVPIIWGTIIGFEVYMKGENKLRSKLS